jgi:hypothetical protein
MSIVLQHGDQVFLFNPIVLEMQLLNPVACGHEERGGGTC